MIISLQTLEQLKQQSPVTPRGADSTLVEQTRLCFLQLKALMEATAGGDQNVFVETAKKFVTQIGQFIETANRVRYQQSLSYEMDISNGVYGEYLSC